ncbi:MAG: hypothetical protein IPM55_18065 [Acidobacteria bacterium]|nr:hypothetical protein [Acidobacteriota bacterium]
MLKRTSGFPTVRRIEGNQRQQFRELAITVVAETKNDGMKVSFHMAVDSQAPHAIQEIRVQPAA